MDPAARSARRTAAAFAIGVGLALTASPGTAWADDTDSGSPDSRPSQSTAERSDAPPTTQQTPQRTTQPSRRQRPATIGNGRETTAERNLPPATTTQTPERATQPVRRSAAIGNGRETTAGNPALTAKDSMPAPAAAVVAPPAPPTAPSASAPAAATEVLPKPAVPVAATSAVPTDSATSPTSNVSAALRQVARVPAPPPAAVMTAASPARSASTAAVTTAAVSAAATNPLDILAAALSALSREINRLFFNRTPTAKPEQYGLSTSAVATGTIGGWDPDDDPLGYSVIAPPTKGSVVVDTAGTFTYTAGAELAGTGGTDTFSVQVRDMGFRLNFWTPTTISVPVTVRIAAPTPTPVDPDPTPPPTVPVALSISDLAVVEGDGGMTHMMFVAGLDRVSVNPVTVRYATANGTATADLDYTATSGMLTFSPGVTEQTIHVTVLGDTADEQDETLTVTMSNPTGAVLAVATAIGTIVDDDETPVALTPGLSISDTSATEPTTGSIAAGFLRTSGNQILDSAGNPVQLSGVNWFGMESSTGAPHGLWTRGYKDMIDQMAAAGFNTIRLPYASEALHTTAAPNGIDFSKNPDLQGLNSVQVMDAVIDYAGQQGLRVILDHHRSGFGAGASENGLWFDSQYTEDAWVADWQMLAERYKDNPTVIGMDLHNEPYNGTWGGGGATDWARAAERAGNAVLAVNPDLLIFVEGVASHQGQSYWWGGNLMGVAARPIVLDVADRVVYSPHDYPNSVYPQPWFQTENFGAALPDKFRQMWGYIYEDGIAPIYVGEFGTMLHDPKDAIWFEAITSYIAGDFDNNGILDIPAGTEDMSWTFWSWNPNSGDTGGILADDWNTVNQNKMAYLTSIQFDGSGSAVATFTVTLSESSSQPVSVGYLTANGTAIAGADYDAATGTLTFAPGETSKTIMVTVQPDSVSEGSETFTVTLSNPIGATLLDATGIGTITDRGAAAPPTEPGGPTEPTDPTEPTEPTEPGGTGGGYIDLMTFGMFHGSDHTGMDGLAGGRTPITTEALVAYNDLRRFAGLSPAGLADVGTWAFANGLTNNAEAWGTDIQGVGLWYAMQGTKVGWIADDKYDPQIIADVERTARLGSEADVMAMVAEHGHDGFADYLSDNGHQTAFINTLKMEPHYAGWMHDRAHGRLLLEGGATAHDVNHLTVLSHDQLQPFMNDTWDWPQWPALEVSDKRVIEYFQSMVALGNPLGDNLTTLDAVPVAL